MLAIFKQYTLGYVCVNYLIDGQFLNHSSKKLQSECLSKAMFCFIKQGVDHEHCVSSWSQPYTKIYHICETTPFLENNV